MDDPKNNFDDLQKLLACKRHEQPPPGYFFTFSDKVIARIEAEESAGYGSWWAWLVDRLDAKPLLVCAYGLAVSGLLLAGLHFSQVVETELSAAPAFSGPWLAATHASPLSLPQAVGHMDYIDPVLAALPARSRSRLVFSRDSARLLLPGDNLDLHRISFAIGGRPTSDSRGF